MELSVQATGAIGAEEERALGPELVAGERLLWAGRPRRGIRLTGADVFLVPFSLLWCGFAVFWERSVLVHGAPGFFALWGLPFVAVGLYFVFGRFIGDAVRRGKIFYGLTATRIILVSGVLTRQVKSIELASLGEISLREGGDRSGTVLLGTVSGPNSWATGFASPSWPGSARYLPPMLEAIENARAVYEKIRATKNQTAT
jgi:hypothetical protein